MSGISIIAIHVMLHLSMNHGKMPLPILSPIPKLKNGMRVLPSPVVLRVGVRQGIAKSNFLPHSLHIDKCTPIGQHI